MSGDNIYNIKRQLVPRVALLNFKNMVKKKDDWIENNILFSEAMAFRASDRQMLIDNFQIWFDYTIKKYGKSKWIELKMQTRLEPK